MSLGQPQARTPHPARISAVLAADRALLEQLIEDAGALLVRSVLLTAAVRHAGGLPITATRLEALVASLREAGEDARAAARAWRNGR